MNIRPLYDRVIVKRTEQDSKSTGGIIIPDSAKEKPTQGVVISVGHGAVQADGSLRPLNVQVGDSVLFGKYSGSEVKNDGETLLVVREDDIMGVVEK
jgi:chaperonin GroES